MRRVFDDVFTDEVPAVVDVGAGFALVGRRRHACGRVLVLNVGGLAHPSPEVVEIVVVTKMDILVPGKRRILILGRCEIRIVTIRIPVFDVPV